MTDSRGIDDCDNCGYAELGSVEFLRAVSSDLSAGFWTVLGPGRNSSIAVAPSVADRLRLGLDKVLSIEIALESGGTSVEACYVKGPADLLAAVPREGVRVGGWYCAACGNYSVSSFDADQSLFTHYVAAESLSSRTPGEALVFGFPRGSLYVAVSYGKYGAFGPPLDGQEFLHPLQPLLPSEVGHPHKLAPFVREREVDWYDLD